MCRNTQCSNHEIANVAGGSLNNDAKGPKKIVNLWLEISFHIASNEVRMILDFILGVHVRFWSENEKR